MEIKSKNIDIFFSSSGNYLHSSLKCWIVHHGCFPSSFLIKFIILIFLINIWSWFLDRFHFEMKKMKNKKSKKNSFHLIWFESFFSATHFGYSFFCHCCCFKTAYETQCNNSCQMDPWNIEEFLNIILIVLNIYHSARFIFEILKFFSFFSIEFWSK